MANPFFLHFYPKIEANNYLFVFFFFLSNISKDEHGMRDSAIVMCYSIQLNNINRFERLTFTILFQFNYGTALE